MNKNVDKFMNVTLRDFPLKRKHGTLFSALLILLNTLPAHAQKPVHFGFWGAVNSANLRIEGLDQIIDFKTLTAWGLGGQLEIALNKHWTILFQPGYLQKGTKFIDVFEDNHPEANIKANYLELPILIRYIFRTEGIRPFVSGGESIGYLLSAKIVRPGDSSDLKDELKSLDFGFTFGAGLTLPIAQQAIFVEGRYSLGIIDINDNVNEPEIKTRGLQFFAGIILEL